MEYCINEIVVPTDFSDAANNALKIAVAVAQRQGATIHLLHIVQPSAFSSNPEAAAGYFGVETALLKMGRESLEQQQGDIKANHGIEVKTFCDIGTISVATNVYVKLHHIDMIIMGTHGTTGAKELLLGSNAMVLIKETNVPVLTIPPSFHATTFNKILYPLRLVEGVVEKYDYIKPIIAKNKSAVHLLGIEQQDMGPEATAKIKQQIETVKNLILTDSLYLSSEVRVAENIADGILQVAREKEVDLMIINATLDRKWHNFLTGSFAQQIVNYAKIPVLSIKPQLTE